MSCSVQIDGQSEIDVYALGIDIWLHISRNNSPKLITIVSTQPVLANVIFELTLRKICQASVRQLKIGSDRVHVAK
ncbi:MAG: hypothetical protein ACK56F_20810, partial [bacterium]